MNPLPYRRYTAYGLTFVTFLLLSAIWATPALAASQHECEIWLCLPSGFGPSQCEPAHHAMEKRISPPHPKPPLPPFSECSQDNDDNGLSYKQGIATYVPEQDVCTRYSGYGRAGRGRCMETKHITAHWEKGQACYSGYLGRRGQNSWRRTNGTPPSEIRCQTTKRTIDIFQRGEHLGNTYRY